MLMHVLVVEKNQGIEELGGLESCCGLSCPNPREVEFDLSHLCIYKKDSLRIPREILSF